MKFFKNICHKENDGLFAGNVHLAPRHNKSKFERRGIFSGRPSCGDLAGSGVMVFTLARRPKILVFFSIFCTKIVVSCQGGACSDQESQNRFRKPLNSLRGGGWRPPN